MLVVDRPADMKVHVGQRLGVSDWVTVDQAMIDKFAGAAGNHQWIRVDAERAKREMPGGKTVAHGFLTLSLLAGLARQIYEIRERSRGINDGSNKVCFTAPVPGRSRMRLSRTLKNVEDASGGVRMALVESTMEVEGRTRPALVAETLNPAYD